MASEFLIVVEGCCRLLGSDCPPSLDLASRGNGLNMGAPDEVNDMNDQSLLPKCSKYEDVKTIIDQEAKLPDSKEF